MRGQLAAHIVKRVQGSAAVAEKPSYYWLFEGLWMDHLCEAVRVNIENLAQGYPSELPSVMREQVMSPLEVYLADLWRQRPAIKGLCTEQIRAQAFYDQAEKICALIDDGYPFEEGDGSSRAQSLRQSWVEFSATCAGAIVSDQQQQRVRASKLTRVAPALTPEAVAAYINAHGTEQEKVIVINLVAIWGASDRTVRRRIKQAKEKGLIGVGHQADPGGDGTGQDRDENCRLAAR